MGWDRYMHLSMAAAAAVGPLTFTKRSSAANNGSAVTSPVVYSGMSIGPASADRWVILQVTNVGAASSANALISSAANAVTINSGSGAINMTKAVSANDGKFEEAIYYAKVPTGTQADISVTITGGTGWSDGVNVSLASITGSADIFVSDTNITGRYDSTLVRQVTTEAVAVPTGGVGVTSFLGSSGFAVTWSGTSGVASASDYSLSPTLNGSVYVNAMAHFTGSGTVIGDSNQGGTPSGFVTAVFQPVTALTFAVAASNTDASGHLPTLPYTTGSLDIGAASSDRVVVLAIGNNAAGTVDGCIVNSVTSGDGSIVFAKAAGAFGLESTQQGLSIWYAPVPTGTTMTVKINCAGGTGYINELTVVAGYLKGNAAASAVAYVTTDPPAYPNGYSNNNTGTVSVPTSGMCVIAAYSNVTGSQTTTWTGATKDTDFMSSAGGAVALAHTNVSGSVNETVSNGGGGSGWIAATFVPTFLPTSIPGLIGWYKADYNVKHAGAIAINGQDIDTWDDAGGNKYHLANWFADKPLLSVQAGVATIEMTNDSNMSMSSHQVADTPGYDVKFGTGSEISYFARAYADASANGGFIGYSNAQTPPSDAGGIAMMRAYGPGPTYGYAHAAGDYNDGAFTAGWHRWGGILSGGNWQNYLDGAANGSPRALSMTFGSPGVVYIRCGSGTVRYREIVIYNRALTSGERAALDTYLAAGPIANPVFMANARPAKQDLGFSGTSMTFTASTGTGTVLVAIGWRVNAGTISVTLNGNPMTLAKESAQGGSNGAQADLFYLHNQTANTASSIVVNCSNSAAATQIATATLTGITSVGSGAAVNDNTAADPHNIGPITIPAGGVGVFVAYVASQASSAAGGGLVQDYATDNSGNNMMALMHTYSTGSVTGSYNASGAANAAVFVPFGP